MNSEESKHTGHPAELLLSYLEDSLNPEDRASIEQHLESCEDCSKQIEEALPVIDALKTSERVFCPESWEIQEFIRRGTDPTGEIREHLNGCELCRKEAATYEALPAANKIPEEIWKAGKDAIKPAPINRAQGETDRESFSLIDRISSIFGIPLMTAAAVAAVIIIVVFVQLRESPKLQIALSGVDWNSEQGAQTMGPVDSANRQPSSPISAAVPQKPLVAEVIVYDTPQSQLTQPLVDNLYRMLKPTKELYGRYNFLTPHQLKDVIKNQEIHTGDKSELVQGLRQKLNVAKAVIITISPGTDGFSVEAELIDAVTGKLLKKRVIGNVPNNAQLGLKISEAANLLE